MGPSKFFATLTMTLSPPNTRAVPNTNLGPHRQSAPIEAKTAILPSRLRDEDAPDVVEEQPAEEGRAREEAVEPQQSDRAERERKRDHVGDGPGRIQLMGDRGHNGKEQNDRVDKVEREGRVLCARGVGAVSGTAC